MNLGILDDDVSGGAVAAANAIAWVVTGIIALFAGAWVAGRMANARTVAEGSLHGLAVWAAGAVVMLLLAFTAAGVIGGGMISLVGQGLEGATALGEVVLPDWDNIRDDLEGALPAVAVAEDENSLRDRSRLFELAGRHFSLEPGASSATERAELVELIAANTGLSQTAAENTLAQWDRVWNGAVERYESARAEALQAAEVARETAMVAAAWAAVAMLLSAAAALFGGGYGTTCRLRLLAQRAAVVPERAVFPAMQYSTRRAEPGRTQPTS